MANKQELRSEETKRAIVAAAGALFAERGFDAVTMREIAKQAGCSHTTIYIYFKDKLALLHQLSMPPLEQLKRRFESILRSDTLAPEDKVKGLGEEFIRFCLANRNMYPIFFVTKSVRVDEAEPELEVNRLRNALFAQLMEGIRQCLRLEEEDARLLAYSRILVYTVHGIVATYNQSEETVDQLMDRLKATFAEAIDVLLLGFRRKMEE